MSEDHADYVIRPLAGCPDEIGRMLWQLEDARQATMRALEKMPGGALDVLPEGSTNTIGTLLYHIAYIETSWLYEDTLEQTPPPDIEALLPYDDRDEQGLLSKLKDFDLDWYMQRLDAVRERVLTTFKAMSMEEFRRERTIYGPSWSYDVTPEWVIYHLVQHETEHRGQIQSLIDRLKEQT